MPSAFENEEQLVDWLSRQLPRVGDDAARIHEGRPMAVTADSQVEGVHFPSGLDAGWIARRLVRVNLSDLAASGAEPAYATCCVASPGGFDLRGFFESLIEECTTFGVELIGGDTTRAPRVHTSLTLLGRLDDAKLGRSAARAGDRLWHSGKLGHAGLGLHLQQEGARLNCCGGVDFDDLQIASRFEGRAQLRDLAAACVYRHRLPTPRLALGQSLQDLAKRNHVAVIDLSDGLVKDAARVAVASAVDLRLDLSALRPTADFIELCQLVDQDPFELAATAGEDYELLFTLPPEVEAPPDCHPIGEALPPSGNAADRVRIDRAKAVGNEATGWDHLSAK